MLASKGSRKAVGSMIGADTILGWGSAVRELGFQKKGGLLSIHTPLCLLASPCSLRLFFGWLGPPGRCAPGPGQAEASVGELAQCLEINTVILSERDSEAGTQPLGSASHFRRVGLCLELEGRHSDDPAGLDLQ